MSPRLVLWLLPFIVLLSSPLFAAGNEQGAELEGLINRALTDNPELQVDEQRLMMSEEKARQAGTFDDPMLMLKLQNGLLRDPFDFDREAETAKVLGVSQAIPFYGKRQLRHQGAVFATEAERWRKEERSLEIRRMVRETWYRMAAVDRNLEILEKNIAALGDLLRLSETMYGVGKALQQDVLKAQLERMKMEEMRIKLEQQRRGLAALLNTLAYRPVDTLVAPIAPTAIVGRRLIQAELELLAEEHRPLLKAQAALIEKAQVGRRLAEKEVYPDFSLSLEYMQREQGEMSRGDDMYSASLSFNLPVQHERRRAMVAEAAAEGRMQQEEGRMLRNRIRLAIAEAVAALERNRRLASLYQDGLLSQAESILETTISAYQAGSTDFMKVLDARMALFSLEREYHEVVSDYQMQVAVLEAILGTELPEDSPK